jgi:plasmid maintenance system antidote protein VapI
MNVTDTIDRALVGRRLTVNQAATRAGVGSNTLYRLRRGDRVSRDVVVKVADVLDLDPTDLWVAMNETADARERAADTRSAA